MTVSIVTVYFLIPTFSLISYITIYILISYVVFRKGYKYFFLIVTTETVTDSAVRYSLISSSIRPIRDDNLDRKIRRPQKPLSFAPESLQMPSACVLCPRQKEALYVALNESLKFSEFYLL